MLYNIYSSSILFCGKCVTIEIDRGSALTMNLPVSLRVFEPYHRARFH